MDDPPPDSRRWRLSPRRISVRALMIAVLVLGVGLGWVVHRARVQRDAVAAIEHAGGRVVYDWAWVDGHAAPPGAGPPAPRWLVDLLGPDYFGHPAAIYLIGGGGAKADDRLLAAV